MNTGTRTILVVEDEFALLEVLALLLERDGYTVVTASDGAEALEKVQHKRPDLLITDFVMPRMTGLELCAHLRASKETAGIPVLMMSGSFAGDLDGTQVVGFLRKPFLYSALQAKVRAVLTSL